MESLFLTNYSEQTFLDKIKQSLRTCQSFYFSVSFIKRAGLVLLSQDIKAAIERGVSRNQLQEMKDEHLTLVVPKDNKSLFLQDFHDNIMTLSDFIGMVKERQS